ncbi:sugar porter family MFS transporter [Streptomyces formicae]|uniref:Sugar porter family MFS transporter n=1 Tax=Streptomyces formicae TaxID=1616117 RepID=A0ABY3WNW9_9ACTN|nr:sugar porter family MFS transporter [Streptomyces formicae]UNM12275.1 sugar porter family MFS transporter [Streptomyces formicae]
MAVALSAGALFGLSIAAMNQTVEQVRLEFVLSSLQQGFVVSGLVAGALLGCLACGALTDRLGRRQMLTMAGVLGTAAAALCAVSPDQYVLFAGRILLGFAVGVASTVGPVLLAELAAAGWRGALITTYQLALTAGVLLAFTVGVTVHPGHNWRLMFLVNAVPAVALAVTTLLIPSSPEDLMAHGEPNRARAVLAATRAPMEARAEWAALRSNCARPSKSALRGLFDPVLRLPVAIALGAGLMNALVGIGAVAYYSTLVFDAAGVGGGSGAELATLSVAAVNLVASVVAVGLISRYGRRPLLTIGLAGITASMATAGGALMAAGRPVTGPLTIVAMLVFITCFAFSAGPLAWVLIAEVLPSEVRVRVAGSALAGNWGANLLVALLFPVIVHTPAIAYRVGLTFQVFAALSLTFLWLVLRFVPETKDRTLAELESVLASRGRRQSPPTG